MRARSHRPLIAATVIALFIVALAAFLWHWILADLGWYNLPPQVTHASSGNSPASSPQSPASQHPLEAALVFAREVQKNLDNNVHDYTATLIKRERIAGQLGEPEICYVKIRNQPLSVYMDFLAPADKAGQEVIFVEGQNDGKLIGHAGSGLATLVGSKWLPVNGAIAMLGQHYPITELGISNLTRRLIQVGESDLRYGDCYVWRNDNAKVGDRPCICITVEHPEKRKEFLFHVAQIFIDKELMVPLRYASYDWPEKPGDPLPLIESYTYANLNLNPGLTDVDFDPNNPAYHFGLQ